jgi:hypothetical protein
MVRDFLERAKETLTDEYMGPFLTAVKELVRTLRKGEYTADDVDAVRTVRVDVCIGILWSECCGQQSARLGLILQAHTADVFITDLCCWFCRK